MLSVCGQFLIIFLANDRLDVAVLSACGKKTDMTWAEFVADLLVERYGNNQSALARAIGVKPQTVQRWVNGGSIEPGHLHQFAAGTGFPLVRLMTLAWEIPADAVAAGADKNKQSCL